MAINLSCWNSKCKFYYEDMCIKNCNEDPMHLDENGKCTTFEADKSDWYDEPKEESNCETETD